MAESVKMRPTVLLPLHDRRAFLKHYFNQGGIGGLFVQGYMHLPSGTEVDVELAFAREQVTLRSRGIIKWKRFAGNKNMPPGIGVELLESERRTRDLLLDFAEGKQVRLTRRNSRRFPAVIEVEYATESVFVCDFTDDISREGAFIVAPDLDDSLQVGTEVRLRIKPPGQRKPIELVGEVRWRQNVGRRGFGVRFRSVSGEAERLLNELIDRVRQQIAAELAGPGAPKA